MNKYSLIIPIFNEENNIKSFIEHIRSLHENIEIIIVDGKSQDNSFEISKSLGVGAYQSPKGRGSQCNYGAKKATGDILIFLHADTKLPKDAFLQIRSTFENQNVKAGTFRMLFDYNHWILKVYSFFTRYDSIFTSFGDQCMVIRKDFYEFLGGFPEWPLFEDVHLLRLARKHTKILSLSGPVVTSARGFLKRGIIKQQILNGILILKYLLGVSPEKLYIQYYNEKTI